MVCNPAQNPFGQYGIFTVERCHGTPAGTDRKNGRPQFRSFFFGAWPLLKGRPMEEIEIWNSASQMVRLYKHGAEMAAASHAADMLGQGDIEGFDVWTQVVHAIRDLEDKGSSVGERVN